VTDRLRLTVLVLAVVAAAAGIWFGAWLFATTV
jgi:hypothetical protein